MLTWCEGTPRIAVMLLGGNLEFTCSGSLHDDDDDDDDDDGTYGAVLPSELTKTGGARVLHCSIAGKVP